MGKKRIIQKSELSEETSSAKPAGVKAGGKKIGLVEKGRVYIQASYNNTLVSLADENGNVIAAASAGALGFRGPKKATPYAANRVIDSLGERIRKIGLKEVSVYVKGIGSGRESAVRALAGQGLSITAIRDVTPMPHNGPRPPKPRRV